MCVCINGNVDVIHIALDFISERREIRGKYSLTTALSVICLCAEAEGSGLYRSNPGLENLQTCVPGTCISALFLITTICALVSIKSWSVLMYLEMHSSIVRCISYKHSVPGLIRAGDLHYMSSPMFPVYLICHVK